MHFSIDGVYHSVVAKSRRSVVRYLTVPTPSDSSAAYRPLSSPDEKRWGLVSGLPGSKAPVPIEYIGNQLSTGPDADLQPSLLCGHLFNCFSLNPAKTHRRSGPGTLVQIFFK